MCREGFSHCQLHPSFQVVLLMKYHMGWSVLESFYVYCILLFYHSVFCFLFSELDPNVSSTCCLRATPASGQLECLLLIHHDTISGFLPRPAVDKVVAPSWSAHM